MGILAGDGFNALILKWPRITTEHDDVEKVVKRELIKHQRCSISESSKGENVFWEKEDRMLPIALYWRLQEHAQSEERNKHPRPVEDDFGHPEKTFSARLQRKERKLRLLERRRSQGLG
ncbi:hypothetical protein K432DRAFT_231611 [Lepidopterella palustris CBS 459.81]|uniref:Uncharacterized protein n=1 Tax=Lepidopterella palustris CBS 459.81 TaxID=1314670 RepID=A0A8E2DXV0_9PEZI|nr:hypothetical protein K432DRAFT_231611 [Lepidopterella palustris CBS 459.81]